MSDLQQALETVYGADADLASQAKRYRSDLQRFRERYGPGPVQIYRAPGRVNLIGEHTDYNHGYVLPMALDRDVLVLIRPRQDATVRLANAEPGFPLRHFELAPEIPPNATGDWANYFQGPAQLLAQEQSADLLGIDALVDSALPHGVPRGAGLSSSSALTVAAASALVGRNRLPLAGAALAEACGRAEWYVGTRGGIMDQFGAVLSQQGHALFLDCRPQADGSYCYRHVPIPSGYDVLVVDSRVRHRNTGPHFNRRVAEGRIGVRLLQTRWPEMTHLRDVEGKPWSAIEPLLPEVAHSPELLAQGIDPEAILEEGVSPQTDTFYVRRRCRHVLSENRRVLDAIEALSQDEVARFGQLMAQAHDSARDDYEISVPEIETLVAVARRQPGVVGARLTGAGWGGCIVVLVESDQTSTVANAITQTYARESGRQARAFCCRSSAGAGFCWETEV